MTAVPPPSGSGPGVITPDGCAVEFYAMAREAGEPGIVHEAAGAGAEILELGGGAGRVTHPLIALGHPVVAVDESAELLAHLRGGAGLRLDRYLPAAGCGPSRCGRRTERASRRSCGGRSGG